jgi:uncharacterized protein (TIGR03435 family)
MTPILAEAVLTVGGSFAASILAKATLAMALALIGVRLARRSRAAFRHVLLAAAFMVLPVLPIASMVAPSIQFEVARIDADVAEYPPAVARVEGSLSSEVVEAIPSVTVTNSQSSGISWVALLTSGWAGGTLLFFLPMIGGLVHMRRLRRFALPWRHGQAVAQQIALDARIHRVVDVLLHESVPGPMTCGILRPAIVLPADARHWTNDDVKRAIVHELEHVRRGDWLMHCVARSVCALYWFHPFVWIAWRQLALEAERACDDAVLRRTEATAYADQLVTLAQRLSTTGRQPLLAMANRGDLPARVRAVLDSAQPRGRAGAMCVAVTLITAVVFVLALSPLSAVARVELPKDRATDTPLPAVVDEGNVDVTPRTTVDELRTIPKRPANEMVDRDVPAASQQAADARARFEVVSIRLNKSGDVNRRILMPSPETFTATNITVRLLINDAYRHPSGRLRREYEITGGPDWIESDGFDIVAKAPGPAEPQQMRAMLQSLLLDRFDLNVHTEMRDQPLYALVVARADGQLGPQLHKSSGECQALGGRGAAPVVVGGPGPSSRTCGFAGRGGPGRMTGVAVTMAQVANTLANQVDREVVDKTGLGGIFDLTLEYMPERRLPQFLSGALLPPADAPSIFTAVQEQLGLKREAQRGLAEVLVIDSVAQPSEN